MKRITAAAALAALLVMACSDATPPPNGDVVLTATAVPVGARSVLLRVLGPATAASAPPGSGYRVFATPAGDTMRVAIIAPSGTSLGLGPLARLTVPDRQAATQYVVVPAQASNASNSLVTPAFAVTVTVP